MCSNVALPGHVFTGLPPEQTTDSSRMCNIHIGEMELIFLRAHYTVCTR